MVDCICVGSNIVTVLANCVDVVLVGVVVVVVQVVVHVGHQIEHEKGEGHKVKGVEAIVALSSRTTWAVNENLFFSIFLLHTSSSFHPVWQLRRDNVDQIFVVWDFAPKSNT